MIVAIVKMVINDFKANSTISNKFIFSAEDIYAFVLVMFDCDCLRTSRYSLICVSAKAAITTSTTSMNSTLAWNTSFFFYDCFVLFCILEATNIFTKTKWRRCAHFLVVKSLLKSYYVTNTNTLGNYGYSAIIHTTSLM